MMSRTDIVVPIVGAVLFADNLLLKILWMIPGFAAALRRAALTGEEAMARRPSALAVGRIA